LTIADIQADIQGEQTMSKRAIIHVEIPAQSRPGSAEFYHKVFGWEFQHMTDPGPYSMSETENKVGIGLPDLDDNIYEPGNVIVYVASDDIAADLKQIEAAGGKRLSETTKVGEMGEMVFFADPTGNRLALWKSFPMGE
jgi:predicted enzyme related to lactoylglutathione lyase